MRNEIFNCSLTCLQFARLFKFEQIARLYTRKNNISITHSCLFSSHIHLLPFDFYSSYKVVTGQLKQSFIQVSFSQIGKEFKNKLFSVFFMFGTNSDLVYSKRGTNNLLYFGIEEASDAVKIRFLDLHWMCKDIKLSCDVSGL